MRSAELLLFVTVPFVCNSRFIHKIEYYDNKYIVYMCKYIAAVLQFNKPYGIINNSINFQTIGFTEEICVVQKFL